MSDFIITEQTKVHSLSLIGELFNIRHIRLKDSRKCKKRRAIYLNGLIHSLFLLIVSYRLISLTCCNQYELLVTLILIDNWVFYFIKCNIFLIKGMNKISYRIK